MDSIIHYSPFAPDISTGRTFHHKSRNGCIVCKKRRLKCDESYPCSRCTLGSLRCIFVNDIDALAQIGQWQRVGSLSTYAALFANIPMSLETLSIPSGRKAIRATVSATSETLLIHVQLAFIAAKSGLVSICRYHLNLAIAIYSAMDSSPDALLASGAILSALFYFLDDMWELYWPAILSGFGILLRSLTSNNWKDFAEQASTVTTKVFLANGNCIEILSIIDPLLSKTKLNNEDFVMVMFLPSQFSRELLQGLNNGDSEALLRVSLWLVLLKRLDRWWCKEQAIAQGKVLVAKLRMDQISTRYSELLLEAFGPSVAN